MSSRKPSAELDLQTGIPTSAGDVAALRARAKDQAMGPAEYLRFLAQFPESPERLRLRPGPRGEPFTLG
jgi:hypothetical protein